MLSKDVQNGANTSPCAFVQLCCIPWRGQVLTFSVVRACVGTCGDPWLWFKSLKAFPSWPAWAKAFLLIGKDDVRSVCIETDKVNGVNGH